MAKVVVDNQNVVAPWRSRLPFIGIAAAAGVAWWVLTSILIQYVIEPLACRSAATLTACGDAPSIAGSLAAILVSVGSLLVFAHLRYARPLFVAIGGAGLLWSLGLYVAGLAWYEALAWSAVLYVLAYTLSLLIAHVRNAWLSVAVLIAAIVLIRLFVAF